MNLMDQLTIKHAFEARLAELNKRYRNFAEWSPVARRDCAISLLEALAMYRRLVSEVLR